MNAIKYVLFHGKLHDAAILMGGGRNEALNYVYSIKLCSIEMSRSSSFHPFISPNRKITMKAVAVHARAMQARGEKFSNKSIN